MCVEVWTAARAVLDSGAMLARCAALLSPQESERFARLPHTARRNEYLVTRAMLRSVLARRTGDRAAALVFAEGRSGKPRLANAPGVEFNVSHTDGLIACAVCQGRALGIDVETIRADLPFLDLARRFFSPHELRDLESLPAARRLERFWRLWVLKEAYVKAHGYGLRMGLSRFSFAISGRRQAVLANPYRGDRAERWQFHLLRPTPAHVMAVAVRASPNETLSLRRLSWKPPLNPPG